VHESFEEGCLLVTKAARRASSTRPARTARINRARYASVSVSRTGGFTLVEAVITLLVLSILTNLAVNSYNSYVKRARAADAIEQLDQFRTHMEKAFQDNGNYGAGVCAVNLPTGVSNFIYFCQLGGNGQAFVANATGSGSMAGYIFSINDQGFRRTEAFPGASVPTDCWMVEKDKCR
jgi:type IV pilus assembly protein PilE